MDFDLTGQHKQTLQTHLWFPMLQVLDDLWGFQPKAGENKLSMLYRTANEKLIQLTFKDLSMKLWSFPSSQTRLIAFWFLSRAPFHNTKMTTIFLDLAASKYNLMSDISVPSRSGPRTKPLLSKWGVLSPSTWIQIPGNHIDILGSRISQATRPYILLIWKIIKFLRIVKLCPGHRFPSWIKQDL